MGCSQSKADQPKPTNKEESVEINKKPGEDECNKNENADLPQVEESQIPEASGAPARKELDVKPPPVKVIPKVVPKAIPKKSL